MRGLKPEWYDTLIQKSEVASFTDAWIETLLHILRIYLRSVASFTDAWIETFVATFQKSDIEVASFTDAWIET